MAGKKLVGLVVILTATILAQLGCSERQRSTLQSMTQIRKELTSRYGAKDVSVMLRNGKHLRIAIANSSLDSLREEELEPILRSLAIEQLKRDLPWGDVESISIALVKQQRAFLILSSSTTRGYTYTVKELKLAEKQVAK